MTEHIQELSIWAGIFAALTTIITGLFGIFIVQFKAMVQSLVHLHTKTLPVLSTGIQEELNKQTQTLERIERQGLTICRHPQGPIHAT